MRRSQHTDQEIAFLLREAENGVAIAAICASARVSLGTFYRWRRRLGGLPPAGVERLGRVERENAALRAEIVQLRRAVRSAQPALRPAPDGRRPGQAAPGPAPRYRGQDACVGRFAYVPTAN